MDSSLTSVIHFDQENPSLIHDIRFARISRHSEYFTNLCRMLFNLERKAELCLCLSRTPFHIISGFCELPHEHFAICWPMSNSISFVQTDQNMFLYEVSTNGIYFKKFFYMLCNERLRSVFHMGTILSWRLLPLRHHRTKSFNYNIKLNATTMNKQLA